MPPNPFRTPLDAALDTAIVGPPVNFLQFQCHPIKYNTTCQGKLSPDWSIILSGWFMLYTFKIIFIYYNKLFETSWPIKYIRVRKGSRWGQFWTQGPVHLSRAGRPGNQSGGGLDTGRGRLLLQDHNHRYDPGAGACKAGEITMREFRKGRDAGWHWLCPENIFSGHSDPWVGRQSLAAHLSSGNLSPVTLHSGKTGVSRYNDGISTSKLPGPCHHLKP